VRFRDSYPRKLSPDFTDSEEASQGTFSVAVEI